jgi:hypothetical protein
MNQVRVFQPQQTAVIGFFDRKGKTHERSVEGALHMGGAALNALKDAAFSSAFEKAENGRYRAAAEIIGAGFPSVYKAVDNVVGTPWANKSTMGTLLNALERKLMDLAQGDKKRTKKQDVAVTLATELRQNVAALAQAGVLVVTNEVDTPTAE